MNSLRKLLLISFLFPNIHISLAQQTIDKVILIDKSAINCKILRVTENSVEIDPEGSIPFQILERSKIDYIIYSDNTVVKMGNVSAERTNETIKNSVLSVEKAYDNLAVGISKFNGEDFDGAIQAFQKEIEINPKKNEAYKYRALAYWKKNDKPNAIADFEKALEIDKYDESVLHLYGVFLANEIGDGKKALEIFNTILELNPVNKLAYLERGKTELFIASNGNLEGKMLINFYNQSYYDLNKAIEFDQNLAEAYYYRGEVIYITGRRKNACLDYKKALELGFEKASERIEAFCKK